MYSLYAWAPNETGDRVKIRFERTKATMIMPTLESLWRAAPPADAGRTMDVISVGSNSPVSVVSAEPRFCLEPSSTTKSAEPRNQNPLRKEQQVLAEGIQSALSRLRGPEGMLLSVSIRERQMQALQIAAFDVLDADLQARDERAVRQVLDAAKQLLDQCGSDAGVEV